ncbi:MAG TPA: class I SAM-dependent methyltransferase [Chryseosolibacter sp.]|nr:class I SAM-dependent methyltransferase [Chryseosolibacter sp.]
MLRTIRYIYRIPVDQLNLSDAVDLIKPAFARTRHAQTWADLGAGSGMFTRALASVLPKGSVIHAVDKKRQAIEEIFNDNAIIFHELDFSSGVLPLTSLNGILMANSLHFIEEKQRLIGSLKAHLTRNGQLMAIEYEMGTPNAWVPYPIPWSSLRALLHRAGFENLRVVGERASAYGSRKMYACVGMLSANQM